MLTPQQRPAYAIAMTKNDPVLKRIAAYPWPRGGIVARRSGSAPEGLLSHNAQSRM
jgi:hypothetical protein